ncbi:hypothetical protein IV203_003023 [Nitzschia inconspicua]|uniref:Uncharacterized protein n=1 Tax=Nitzschia inconspicua TaxID=303405 RepID=A0A9K3PNB9_9STRA|nr:hypothetical protein IV203_003023 [Nitzschia inconspicua]
MCMQSLSSLLLNCICPSVQIPKGTIPWFIDIFVKIPAKYKFNRYSDYILEINGTQPWMIKTSNSEHYMSFKPENAGRRPSGQRALNVMTKNYLCYQKGHDLLVTEPSTPADHVLADHSIKTIMSVMW